MLRWTENELRHQDEGREVSIIWRLVCMILLDALRKDASIIFVKKTTPTRLSVLYAIDGALQEQMPPPSKLHTLLVGRLMTLCGPLDIEPGARGMFEVIRPDGTLLIGHALASTNEPLSRLSVRDSRSPGEDARPGVRHAHEQQGLVHHG